MNTPKRIKLNGGPKDGEVLLVSESILQYRRLEIYIAPKLSDLYAREDSDAPDTIYAKTGFYEMKRMFAGEPNTCAFREWTEWHWDGTVY